jgi:hypothetical protein
VIARGCAPLAVLALVATTGAHAQKELRTPAKGSLVVATVALDAKTKADIAVGDCVRAKGAPKDAPADCAVTVAIKGKGKKKLEWAARAGPVYVQNDHSVAIGDDADSAMALSWRVVEPAKGLKGIVVTQQTGAERTKRRHDVFLDFKGKMLHALEATEPRGGGTFSSITSVDLDNDTFGELVLIQSRAPDEEIADIWTVQVFAWRSELKKLVEMPSWRPTIQGGVVGMFATVAEARELQKNKCLHEFLVVDYQSATLLPQGIFAVSYLAPTKGDAELGLEAAKGCDEKIVGSVKKMTPGLEVAE